jgi:hypothetical protein
MRFIRHGIKGLLVVAAVCGFALGGALAQGAGGQGAAGQGAGGQGEQTFKQIKLTPKHIESFIAAQREMADFAAKQEAKPSDQPDPKIQAQLDDLARKHGFADFAEFDDIAFNISIVMGGLDPQTGKFTDPVTAIKEEIDAVKADKSIKDKDKKQMLEELNEALKNTPPLQYPENVEVVKKYRDEIDKVLQ